MHRITSIRHRLFGYQDSKSPNGAIKEFLMASAERAPSAEPINRFRSATASTLSGAKDAT
jgi:hypothetical protein